MATDKGFTLLELLLAGVLTLILLGMSIPFFVAQSSYSYNSFQDKTCGEAMELALQLMRRDLIQSGYGVTGFWEPTAKTNTSNMDLSLFVVRGTGTAPSPDTMYINYNGHLNTRGDVEVLPTQTVDQQNEKAFIGANCVMMEGLEFTCPAAGKIPTQGWLETTYPLILRGIPSHVTKASIGALIYKTKGSNIADGAVPLDVDATVVEVDPPSGTPAGYQKMTFYGHSIPPGKIVAPAIAYQVDKGTHSLWRNGGKVVPPTSSTSRVQPLIGGTQHQSLQVMDFKVRCQFRDTSGNTSWWPDSGIVFGTGTCALSNLKQVEVSIAYRYWMKSGGLGKSGRWNGPDTETVGGPRWMRKVITVSPRTVALKTN